MRGDKRYHATSAGGATVGRRNVLRAAVSCALSTAVTSCSGARRYEKGASAAETSAGRELRWGVQTGDVSRSRAVVWSRADAPSRMVVEWSLSERFERRARVDGPLVVADTDFTGKV